MKRRMITLLLALVLVVSLLPMASAASLPAGTFNLWLRGQRYEPGWSGGSGFAYISGCIVTKTFTCPRCEEDKDHASGDDGTNHAILASEVKQYIGDMQNKVNEIVTNQRMLVVGLTQEYPHDADPYDVHAFAEYTDTDLIDVVPGQGYKLLYFVAIPCSVKVDVNCIPDSGHTTAEYDLKTESIKSVTTGKSSVEGTFTCQLVIDKAPYIAEYNNANGTHRNADAEETLTLNLTYSRKTGEWTCAHAQINVTCMPDAPSADGLGAVDVTCSTLSAHGTEAYALEANTYTLGPVTKNTDGTYTCTGTVAPGTYVGKYTQDHENKLHVLDEDASDTTFTFTYGKEKSWTLSKKASLVVRCEPDSPTADIVGMTAVKVDCTANAAHEDEIYALAESTYALSSVAFENGKYVVTGKVNVPDSYVEAYVAAHGAHTLDEENSPATFTLVWDAENGEWTLQEYALLAVKCGSGYNPTAPILAALNKTAPRLNTTDHFAYVQGYPDGTVKPAGSITRAEVAAIFFRLMDADSRSLYYSTASGFRDVDSTKWYNTYVATLNNAGVITDSRTGYFRPNDAITRAELAAMLAQFAEKKSAAIYFSDVSAGYWAANAIALTANLGWINGYPDGTFGPDKTVTRAELMAMVNRATGRAPKSTSALLSGMKTWKDNADTARWYYLDVQEATNSHTYTGAPTETWTSLTTTPDWSQYE